MKEQQKFRYIAWKSPDEMHFTARQWNSTLAFIKDEHLFFEDMLREYTLPIIESNLVGEIRLLIERLDNSKKELEKLNQKVLNHQNALEIMVDGKDQPEEEMEYKEAHRGLLQEMNTFTGSFENLKKDIFKEITAALKKQKQNRLLQ